MTTPTQRQMHTMSDWCVCWLCKRLSNEPPETTYTHKIYCRKITFDDYQETTDSIDGKSIPANLYNSVPTNQVKTFSFPQLVVNEIAALWIWLLQCALKISHSYTSTWISKSKSGHLFGVALLFTVCCSSRLT